MTFLEELTAHKCGLIRLKGGLYWYGGRGWDGVHDRICLLMDSVLTYDHADAAASAGRRSVGIQGAAIACLLIDSRPHWVWIAPEDVELL